MELISGAWRFVEPRSGRRYLTSSELVIRSFSFFAKQILISLLTIVILVVIIFGRKRRISPFVYQIVVDGSLTADRVISISKFFAFYKTNLGLLVQHEISNLHIVAFS